MGKYEIIGLMSGTSMDGLDVAHVMFTEIDKGKWEFELKQAQTFPYDHEIKAQLETATQLNVPSFLKLDKALGAVFAEIVNSFVKKNGIDKSSIDAIASHGHTTHHQPQNGFTCQIGCGAILAHLTDMPVVNDFRTKDILAGGQGAPLVPIGDLCLFTDLAASFLNIGGISNISFKKNKKTLAFDICPGNLPLNKLVLSKGIAYDNRGKLASGGEINFFLLDLLNSLPYYEEKSPKSLGTEWMEQEFYPLIKFNKDIENNLRTVIEHEAFQISKILNENQLESVFITGGGAKNSFLIERLKHYYKGEVIIPEETIVDFKEAIIFGFLGALHLAQETNTISSVTGAAQDVRGGVLHQPG
jgi:anhydro-N-acetylmuramic acid kinase